MDWKIAEAIVRNAHRAQYLATQRVLFAEITDPELFSRIGEKLAWQQLEREQSTLVDTHITGQRRKKG